MKAARTIALTAAGAVALGVAGAQAQDTDYTTPTGPVTIKMKLKGKNDPLFTGPKRISQGREADRS